MKRFNQAYHLRDKDVIVWNFAGQQWSEDVLQIPGRFRYYDFAPFDTRMLRYFYCTEFDGLHASKYSEVKHIIEKMEKWK